MMELRERSKYIARVLVEQCKVVGLKKADIAVLDLSEGWFREQVWNLKQRTRFEKWMLKYLRTNGKAREALLGYTYNKTVKYLKKCVAEWVWNYGWREE
jgi:hypothetical protein